MSSTSRGGRQIASALASSLSTPKHICFKCRQSISPKRRYASAATAQATIEPPSLTQIIVEHSAASPLPQPRFTLKAGVVLSRPPIITPNPHPFETAYYLYQRRLNERLVLPFTQYFYYKPGTPGFEHWRTKRRERNGVATRDIGRYNAYTKESWNDEVLVGSKDGDPEEIVRTLIEEEGRADEFSGEGQKTSLAGLRRVTEADENGDQKSLERALQRTLYLLVKRKGKKDDEERGLWTFPSAVVDTREGLREGAQRALDLACGVNMNTWFIGNHPVGHYVYLNSNAKKSAEKATKTEEMPVSGDKTFFMKARIMAGQADVTGNKMDVEDYRWLSKDEIEGIVHPYYWSRVKNMLVEQ